MFNYREFKKDMQKRGHKVHKHGNRISIIPNNNYLGYTHGFQYAEQIIDGYERFLSLTKMDHYNTWIYSAVFKIK